MMAQNSGDYVVKSNQWHAHQQFTLEQKKHTQTVLVNNKNVKITNLNLYEHSNLAERVAERQKNNILTNFAAKKQHQNIWQHHQYQQQA